MEWQSRTATCLAFGPGDRPATASSSRSGRTRPSTKALELGLLLASSKPLHSMDFFPNEAKRRVEAMWSWLLILHPAWHEPYFKTQIRHSWLGFAFCFASSPSLHRLSSLVTICAMAPQPQSDRILGVLEQDKKIKSDVEHALKTTRAKKAKVRIYFSAGCPKL